MIIKERVLDHFGRLDSPARIQGKVFAVGMQHGRPCIWISDDAPDHEIIVMMTGEDFPYPASWDYVETFIDEKEDFVGHIFQREAK